MISSPLSLAAHLGAHPISDDEVLLLSERDRFALNGRVHAALVPLLDGSRDGTVTLWLDEPSCAWRVQSGAVQVFAATWVDGRPAGQRHPLFVVGAGDVLMAAPRGAALALVAAGLEPDTTVVQVAPEAGAATARWLSALVLALQAPASEQEQLLARAQAFDDPQSSPADIDALAIELLSGLERGLREADAELARMLEHRAQRERDLRGATYTGLGTLLGAGRVRELAAVRVEDPVLAAIELVAGQLGARVVAPPASGQSEPERIESIVRASGMRACDARLTQSWWRQDCGPLLGRMREDGRPVALLQRRPGQYECVDPAAGTRKAVDADMAATLFPEAVTFYRPLPDGKLRGRDVLRYVLGGAVKGDAVRSAPMAWRPGCCRSPPRWRRSWCSRRSCPSGRAPTSSGSPSRSRHSPSPARPSRSPSSSRSCGSRGA